MNRNLISQIKHEWKPNFWLVIELMIVSVVIAALMCVIVNTVRIYNTPRGFDAEGVYSVSIKFTDNKSPYYVDLGEDTEAETLADQYVLINRLRANGLVEAVAATINCVPYNLSFMGSNLMPVNDTLPINVNMRFASPDIVRVLRLRGENGESMERMEKVLRGGLLVARDPSFEEQRRGVRLFGMQVYMGSDTVNRYKIEGILPNIRRNDFEENNSGMMLKGIDESITPSERFWNVLVRVRPGQEKKFEETFNSDESLRHYRNVTFYDLSSLQVERIISQNNETTLLRTEVALTVFFLLIVFLGLLGSFWYRVQQRRREIALRKVCGAKKSDIFRRLIAEGSILLIAATVPAVLVDWLLVRKLPEDMVSGYSFGLIVVAVALAYVLMELIIIAGVSMPAYKAMRTHPADALKDD